MISRIWHGWTTRGNADKYETMLREEIFVGIENRHIRGFKGIQLLRREAGEDYEMAVVPDKARTALSHFDGRSQHYEMRVERKGSE